MQQLSERRTTADDVFDHLYAEIVSLKLLPGTKMSEVEIAKQFDVSRQPVREAFIRLGNFDLLKIRPQKATVVRKFSRKSIANARFVRTAIEVEVLAHACKLQKTELFPKFEKNLEQQRDAIEQVDPDRFHSLDYSFHKLLCKAADCEFAFDNIARNKAQVDRLCMLSISHKEGMVPLLEDHMLILGALKENNVEAISNAIRVHLGRLDATVEAIKLSHEEYFED